MAFAVIATMISNAVLSMVGGHYSKPLAGPVLHLQVRD